MSPARGIALSVLLTLTALLVLYHLAMAVL